MDSTLSTRIGSAKNARIMRSLVIYARMLGISWDVEVVFDPTMTTAATDGRRIVLCPLDVGDDEDATLVEGLIAHEAGVHCRFTDFKAAAERLEQLAKSLKAVGSLPQIISSLSNVFEDVWGERELYKIMPGCRNRIAASLDILSNRGVFGGPTQVVHPASAMMNMLLCGLRTVKLEQTRLADFYLQHRQMLEDQVGPELVDQIWSTAQKIDGVSSSTAAIDLAVEVYSLIKEAQKKAEEQAKQAQPSQGQPSQGQPSQGQPSQGQPSQGQLSQGQPSQGQPSQGQPSQGQPSQGQPSQGQPSQGQPSQGQPTGSQPVQSGTSPTPTPGPSADRSADPSATQQSNHSPQSSSQKGNPSQLDQPSSSDSLAQNQLGKPGSRPGAKLTQQQIDNMRKVLQASKQDAGTGELADAMVAGMSDKAAPQTAGGFGAGSSWDLRPSTPVANPLVDHAIGVLARPVAVKLGSKLDQVLAVQTMSTTELSVRGRRLSARMIPRLMTAATMRVFKHTDEAEALDVAVSILQDISSSMSAPLDDHVPCINAVGASTRALGDTMERFDIPFSVHQFGSRLTTVKAFDDRWRQARSLHYQELEGSTCTHQALSRIVPQLAARNEERRVLVLETDGIPSDVTRTIAALSEAMCLGINVAVFLVGATVSLRNNRLVDFMREMTAHGIPHSPASSAAEISKALFDVVSSATSRR